MLSKHSKAVSMELKRYSSARSRSVHSAESVLFMGSIRALKPFGSRSLSSCDKQVGNKYCAR